MTKKNWHPALCLECAHFYTGEKYGSCKAFPQGIPHAILSGELGHFRSVEGDDGIVYKPREKTDRSVRISTRRR